MANLAKFKDLLAAEATDTKRIPAVTLRQNTDIGQAFARIVTLDNRREGETDGDLTARYVDEFCNSLGQPCNKPALDLFDTTCSAFSDKIKGAWDSLSGIKEQASELSKEMEDAAQEFISKDPYVTANSKFLTISEDFPVFNWEGAKILGPKNEVAKDVNALVLDAAATNTGDLDHRLFSLAVKNLDKHAAVVITDVDEDTRTSIIDQLQSICSETPKEAVEACVDYIIGVRKFPEVYNILKYIDTLPANDMFSTIKTFDSFINVNFPMLDAVTSGQVNITNANAEQLKTNANSIVTFCKLAAYYELMERETVYRDVVLLQGGLINSDYSNEFEQAGGNKGMIARHVRMMYRDENDQIPVMGIRGQTIIDSDADISKKVETDMSQVKSRITLAKTTARVTAFKKVGMEYIARKASAETPDNQTTIANKVTETMNGQFKSIAEAVRLYDIDFMSAALSLVVSVGYDGTFVSMIKDRLGLAYIMLASNAAGQVTDESIRCAEVGVIADLVSEFVAEKMIEVIPGQEVPAPDTPVQTPEEIKKEPDVAPAQESPQE